MLAQGVPRPSPVQRRALDKRKMRGSRQFLCSGRGEEIALSRRRELRTRGKGIGEGRNARGYGFAWRATRVVQDSRLSVLRGYRFSRVVTRAWETIDVIVPWELVACRSRRGGGGLG